MSWTAKLIEVSDPLNGNVTLTYQFDDPDTGRTFRESVAVSAAQTDAWIQNRGAGRAIELDNLEAFRARAVSAIGPVQVTDYLATLPPPTAEQLAAQAWVSKAQEALQIRAANQLGVATQADLDRLAVLVADLRATYLPSYKQFLR